MDVSYYSGGRPNHLKNLLFSDSFLFKFRPIFILIGTSLSGVDRCWFKFHTNIICLNTHLGSKKFARFTSEPKKALFRIYFGKTNYEEFVLAQCDFERLVRAPNESLRLI